VKTKIGGIGMERYLYPVRRRMIGEKCLRKEEKKKVNGWEDTCIE